VLVAVASVTATAGARAVLRLGADDFDQTGKAFKAFGRGLAQVEQEHLELVLQAGGDGGGLARGVAQRGHGSDGGPERQAVPTELYLVRYQYAGEADEWLYLGDGHHGLDVSPETAQRLIWAIGWLMDTKAARR